MHLASPSTPAGVTQTGRRSKATRVANGVRSCDAE